MSVPILDCDDGRNTGRPHRHGIDEPTTPQPPSIPASTYTHTPKYTTTTKPKAKTKPKNKGVVKRVIGSFTREHSKPRRIQHDGVSSNKGKRKARGKGKEHDKDENSNSNKNKQETITETPKILDEERGRENKDRLACYQIPHQQERYQPTNGEECDERKLVQLWQKNLRERERRGTMMMHGEQWQQQARTGPGPAVAMAVQAAGGGGGRGGGKSPSYAHPRQPPRPHMKSRPHPHNNHNNNSPHNNTRQKQPPLALRTRNVRSGSGGGSGGRKGSVNYAYPLHSPKNGLPPPGGLLRRESSDSNSHGEGENTYASDASSNNGMMTINVYRSASLAHGHGQGQSESDSDSGSNNNINGLGISVQETLDRDRPTSSSTPQDSYAHGHGYGEALDDYFNNDNDSRSREGEPQTRGRKMSIKEIHHKHRTPARKSKVIHRRRQTRYGRPSIPGGGGQAPSATSTTLVPYSEDSEWLDINGPLSTPAWYKWASEGGSERAAQPQRLTPRITQTPLQIPCPMPGCNNVALPNVGLCSDCRIAPRDSVFVSSPKRIKSPRRRSSRLVTHPIIEFNRVSGPFSPLGSLDDGNPGDMGLARSKFNAKFSPRPDFKLQPPPGGRKVAVAAKRDSEISTGSDRSHVGFQMAVSRTPEPTRQQEPERDQQRRYIFAERNDDEVADADPGSATSAESWEDSRWASDVPPSARSSGAAVSPSPRSSWKQSWNFSRGSAESKGYSDKVDVNEKSEHDVTDNGDRYTVFHDIIDLYLDSEDNSDGNGKEDGKPEKHPDWDWM